MVSNGRFLTALFLMAVLPLLAASPVRLETGSAMAFLEHVTGELPANEEKAWWDVGRYQHGPDARRYHIAFAGYAAAALAEADPSLRARAGKVLADCIARMLRRDVWAYSQSPKRWGEAAWAPDPCYRENVMYTGHLLQLLAFYERLTGDTRFWTKGFDFVWSKEKTVHYTVGKLIDVTVAQMRENGCGGVSCEPGLVFFPCNNHPHVALKLFSALGHGDWSTDARKWETWALDHYPGPLFGGGAVKYVYHLKSGLFYPRGSAGMDGWSLLWYEPWATDRGTALGLWRKAADKIDWASFSAPAGACTDGGGCCDPAPVPTAVAAVFLAAAARACDDAGTAERLEAAVDACFLKEEKGLPVLDVARNWRIGATAVRILSFAESRGVRLRNLLGDASTPLVRFGVVTDVHYADKPPMDTGPKHPAGKVFYRESLAKMEKAVAVFNALKPDFVIELGDLKDFTRNRVESLAHLDRIEAAFAKFEGPRYHVLGNHDMDCLTKEMFFAHAPNDGRVATCGHYAFVRGGVTFVVLDACYNHRFEPYGGDERGMQNWEWYDAWVPPAELKWLEMTLAAAKGPVVIFCHQRLDPLAAGVGTEKHDHAVRNAAEVRVVLERSGKVRSVLTGHEHRGGFYRLNGIAYHSLYAMAIDGPASEANSFFEVAVSPSGDLSVTRFVR